MGQWRRGLRLRHRGDEPVTPPREGLDVTGGLGRVAQGLPQLPHRRVEAVVEVDERVRRPELVPQLLSGHHLARALQEQDQQAKRLILQPDLQSLPAQLPETRGRPRRTRSRGSAAEWLTAPWRALIARECSTRTETIPVQASAQASWIACLSGLPRVDLQLRCRALNASLSRADRWRHRSRGLRVEERRRKMTAKSRVAGRSAGIGRRQDGRVALLALISLPGAGAGRRRDGLEPDHAAGGGGGEPQPAAAAQGRGDGPRGDARRRELRRAAVRGLCRAGVAVRGSLDRGGGGPGGLRRADPAAARAGGHAGRGPLGVALQDPRRARQGRGPGGGRGRRCVRSSPCAAPTGPTWTAPTPSAAVLASTSARRRPSGTPASPPGASSRRSCSSAATSSGPRVRRA